MRRPASEHRLVADARRIEAFTVTRVSRSGGRMNAVRPVAQGIEQRFPKPRAVGSSPTGGASKAMSCETTGLELKRSLQLVP